METILEQQRRLHEEKERIIEAMVKETLHKKSSNREQINSDHRTKKLLDKHMENTAKLRDIYEDKDGLRKEEVMALSGPNEFQEFYARLKTIKDFHRKHPNEIAVPLSHEYERMDEERSKSGEDSQTLVEFTDEEGYGKYLDLHECFDKYVNLKNVEKIDYLTYLANFDQLFSIQKDRKNAEYRRYLELLLDYLHSYTRRLKPLLEMSEELEKVRITYESQWESGSFPGWGKEAASALAHAGAHLDLSAFSSPEELASLGLDRLKSALMALGLKCGGTLEERAQRLFSTKGVPLDQLDASLFAKSKTGKGGKKDNVGKQKDMAYLEAQVYFFAELLGEQRLATRENIQRKQARTDAEREDDEEEQYSDSDSDDDDNEVIYNPKNLPLGWDGKPIPYWLYKLHGLNITYSCEICGNQTYRGPKAFQRHFAEWRHAHGMRCLGIPNTAHFANVTLIEDALSLWDKLKDAKSAERWRPDTEEEFEDSSGNVVNKKVFEDLKRQGLL
ncbi:splicing factor 3A subunit 3-like [Asterias rubens]|uniref:splicing factor 3A subunit 3-like n=1 Tax=Asterias rubens TaxID=7604 RepID=UPI001455CCE3|nr:splicing factor 3A subunit 3-like [Asterias rubens]